MKCGRRRVLFLRQVSFSWGDCGGRRRKAGREMAQWSGELNQTSGTMPGPSTLIGSLANKPKCKDWISSISQLGIFFSWNRLRIWSNIWSKLKKYYWNWFLLRNIWVVVNISLLSNAKSVRDLFYIRKGFVLLIHFVQKNESTTRKIYPLPDFKFKNL